jgi:hypothetical protein
VARASRPSADLQQLHFERRSKQVIAGTRLPSEAELLRGMPFYRDDVREDIKEFSERAAEHIRFGEAAGLDSLLGVLDSLALAPGAEALALLEAEFRDYTGAVALPTDAWRIRCRIYRAASGDADAAALVAAEIAALGLEDIRQGHGRDLVWRSLGWAVHSRRMEDWHGTGARISFAKNHSRQDVAAYATEFSQAFDPTAEVQGGSAPGGRAAQKLNEMTDGSRSGSGEEGVVVFKTVGMATTKGGAEVGKDYKHLIGKALPLSPVPDIDLVQRILLEEFPYAASAIDTVLRDLDGREHVHVRPTLLIGPPGAGKSHFARRLAEVLKIPWEMIPCAGVSDSMHGGTSRKWTTGEPSLPVAVIRAHSHAGPVVILDEIEKAGTSRHNGNLHDVLHGLLERETAVRWHDPYIDAPCDLSHISWIMTANTVEPVPKSLRDRCRCLRFPEPGPEHLVGLAQRLLAELYREKGFDPKWALPLDGVEMRALSAAWPGGSIRTLQRIVERLIDVREATMTRC